MIARPLTPITHSSNPVRFLLHRKGSHSCRAVKTKNARSRFAAPVNWRSVGLDRPDPLPAKFVTVRIPERVRWGEHPIAIRVLKITVSGCKSRGRIQWPVLMESRSSVRLSRFHRVMRDKCFRAAPADDAGTADFR